MIVDARQVPNGFVLDAHIAIVGAGPAGITLAHELMGAGLTVALLEAGERQPETRRLDSFAGEVLDPARHPPLTLYRVRGLGGGSTLWGGRCVPFDPIDLEARPHVPHSGWPLAYDELKGWYRHALAYCEAGPFRFHAGEALNPDADAMVRGLGDGRIASDSLERFSPPTDFGRRYRRALARSPEVTLVLGANCTGLSLSENRQAVTGAHFATAAGHGFSVRAGRVVLAAGALETTRLMLASGAGNDLVGRFYMCHLEGKAAVARFRPGTRVVFQYERDRDGIYVRRHFSLPADIQRQRQLTNVILRFEPPLIADPTHGDAVLSAMWLSRTFLKAEYERKLASFGYRGVESGGRRTLIARHLVNVGLGAPALARFGLIWTLRHVLAARKLPYVAVKGRDGNFTLDYNAEQVPNPDSRVTLSDQRDHLGLPRLRVDWRVTAQDIQGVLDAHRLLAEELEASGTGRLLVDEDAIRHGYNAVGGHHMGTTRMAAGPDRGVVDSQCRVFGMDNLYVAGASVFSTSSHANPTLTLVALAARLAAHLRELERRPAASTAWATVAEAAQ
ncbi:MAG TPA: GMC family oxidoreductase [Magnetospirillum sp.]|nr:GMC family oxidoreductase [Magnetospirillum sp.]